MHIPYKILVIKFTSLNILKLSSYSSQSVRVKYKIYAINYYWNTKKKKKFYLNPYICNLCLPNENDGDFKKRFDSSSTSNKIPFFGTLILEVKVWFFKVFFSQIQNSLCIIY